jgi:hypothetical protein
MNAEQATVRPVVTDRGFLAALGLGTTQEGYVPETERVRPGVLVLERAVLRFGSAARRVGSGALAVVPLLHVPGRVIRRTGRTSRVPMVMFGFVAGRALHGRALGECGRRRRNQRRRGQERQNPGHLGLQSPHDNVLQDVCVPPMALTDQTCLRALPPCDPRICVSIEIESGMSRPTQTGCSTWDW